MKTNIVGIIIALILTFVGMLSVYAQDTKVSEVRKVDAFSSIEITSVGTIYFTQSDTYSFKIEGKEKHVKNTETTVKDGCLLIGFKDRKNKSMRNQKDGVTIWISAPDLIGTSRTVRSGRPNAYFYNRVDAAAALYHAGKVEYLVISGDNGRKGYNEPQDMEDNSQAASFISSISVTGFERSRDASPKLGVIREQRGNNSA